MQHTKLAYSNLFHVNICRMEDASVFKQEMLVDFYTVLSYYMYMQHMHDYFFRCYMYFPFRAEFAAGTWRRNSYILWVVLNMI
jgi:hypothetical protein